VKRLVFQRSGRVFGLGPRRGSGGLPLHQLHCCRNFCNCSGLMAWIAALCSLSVMEASQCAENGSSEIVNIDLDGGVGLLVLGVKETEVATEIDQGGTLVVQLEFDAPDRARRLAAVVEEILERHFAERRRLVSSQGRKIEVGVALRVGPDQGAGAAGDKAPGTSFNAVR
jgi:hypothetical protein